MQKIRTCNGDFIMQYRRAAPDGNGAWQERFWLQFQKYRIHLGFATPPSPARNCKNSTQIQLIALRTVERASTCALSGAVHVKPAVSLQMAIVAESHSSKSIPDLKSRFSFGSGRRGRAPCSSALVHKLTFRPVVYRWSSPIGF